MILCCTGPHLWNATMFELQTKHLQLHVVFFSHRADQIKQAPAPAQSGFNLHGPRCHSNLTTSHCSLPTLHPSISHLACYARTPSLWLHSHIVVWTHNTCCHRRQLSPTCHDIDTQTDSLRQSCARVREAATPPAGWMGKKHPTNSQPEELYNPKIT